MNKFLTIILLLMFVPLASQVNAQDEEWRFKPFLKRINGVPVADVAPEVSPKTEIRRNTANNLYIGLFIHNEGNFFVPPTRDSFNSNGVVGAEEIKFNINLAFSGGLTPALIIDSASDKPFMWHPTDAIDDNTSNNVNSEKHPYEVSIGAKSGSTAENSAVRCPVRQMKCDIFLGTFEFDLESYPDVDGAVELSISHYLY